MKDWMKKIIIFVAVLGLSVTVGALTESAKATVFHRIDADTAIAGASLKLKEYYSAHEDADNALYTFLEEKAMEAAIAESEAEEAAKRASEEAEKQAAEEAAKEASEEAARKASEEAAKKAAEQAAAKKAAQEAAAKKAAEQAAQKAIQEAAKERSSTTGRQIADYAASFVGVLPYVWGGTSLVTGCDCSGFIATIYAKYGYLDVTLAAKHYYDSRGFRYIGKAVTYDASSLTALVKYLLPGDIICYEGHVAMYYGNGIVVHEPAAPRKAEFGNVMMKPIITIRRLVLTGSVVTPTQPTTEPATEPSTAPTTEPATEPTTEPTESQAESTENEESTSTTAGSSQESQQSQQSSAEPTNEAPAPD